VRVSADRFRRSAASVGALTNAMRPQAKSIGTLPAGLCCRAPPFDPPPENSGRCRPESKPGPHRRAHGKPHPIAVLAKLDPVAAIRVQAARTPVRTLTVSPCTRKQTP
jgi:hypothetical protein